MSDYIQIYRPVLERILDSYYRFFEDRYHRAVVTKSIFLHETLYEDVTMPPDLLKAIQAWEAKPEH